MNRLALLYSPGCYRYASATAAEILPDKSWSSVNGDGDGNQILTLPSLASCGRD